MIWDNNPDRNIAVGFGSNASTPVLKFGRSTDENTWQNAAVTRSATLDMSLGTSVNGGEIANSRISRA